MTRDHFAILGEIERKHGLWKALKYDWHEFAATYSGFSLFDAILPGRQEDHSAMVELMRADVLSAVESTEPMLYVDKPILTKGNVDVYNQEPMNALEAVRSGLYTPTEALAKVNNQRFDKFGIGGLVVEWIDIIDVHVDDRDLDAIKAKQKEWRDQIDRETDDFLRKHEQYKALD